MGLGDPIIFSAEHNIGFDELYLGLKELEEKLAEEAGEPVGKAGEPAEARGLQGKPEKRMKAIWKKTKPKG